MIELWELGGKGGRRYSLFSWRTRMALAHKALAFTTHAVAMSDKAAIAFSGGKTVPVLKDGETVVRDSWRIAEYLEAKYPDKPLFGGAIGRGVTHALNAWADRALLPALLPVLAPDIHERVLAEDEGYFRQSMEKVLKQTLEQAGAGREEALRRFHRALEPLRAALKREPYVCGEAPAYGDYIVFSLFQWARVMSPQPLLAPDDALLAWQERLLDLHAGFARAVPTA